MFGESNGQKKERPELVEELIENRWNADYEDWDEKYNSLSSSDMSKVADAVNGMEKEFYNNNEDDSDGFLSVYDAADIWMSNGKDEDYMFGYTEEELEDAL